MMRRPHRGAGPPGLGLLLLAGEVARFGLHRVPPVTLAAIGLNTLLFVAPLGAPVATCLGVEAAWGRREWRRLALAPVHHADDLHLYFNMASLLWKGSALERRLGAARFALLMVALAALGGVVQLATAATLYLALDSYGYMLQCAVGFSGVLFGLKVINNHYNPGGVTYLMNMFPVPTRYACWAELILIHLLVPSSSFIGHLSGILVGLCYVFGPLRRLLDGIVTFSSQISRGGGRGNRAGDAGFYRREETRARYWSDADAPPDDPELQEALRASLRDASPRHASPRRASEPRHARSSSPPEALMLSPEELRRRRLDRLSR